MDAEQRRYIMLYMLVVCAGHLCMPANIGEAILRLFRVSHNRATFFEPRSAIFPGHQAPVVRKGADGERELVVLNWGFVLLH
jgi:hypothetical protein